MFVYFLVKKSLHVFTILTTATLYETIRRKYNRPIGIYCIALKLKSFLFNEKYAKVSLHKKREKIILKTFRKFTLIISSCGYVYWGKPNCLRECTTITFSMYKNSWLFLNSNSFIIFDYLPIFDAENVYLRGFNVICRKMAPLRVVI